jgi:hypothetical protein
VLLLMHLKGRCAMLLTTAALSGQHIRPKLGLHAVARVFLWPSVDGADAA